MHGTPHLVIWLSVSSNFLPRLRLSMCTWGYTWKCCMFWAASVQIIKSDSGFNSLKDAFVQVVAAAARASLATKDYNLVVVNKLSVSRKIHWKILAWQYREMLKQPKKQHIVKIKDLYKILHGFDKEFNYSPLTADFLFKSITSVLLLRLLSLV